VGTIADGRIDPLVTIEVSVVIATYNRAELLGGTLRALASQQSPESLGWEILVVDNNSRDATAQVVAEFSKTTAIPVRSVFEPLQGLSRARNRGIQAARGAIIAFTDDDVIPAPDWIVQVAAAMDRWNAHGVGGRILPRWETPPPEWLTQNRQLLNYIAVMDVETSRLLALPLAARPQVWGANMAFRRELFERVGGFDPQRGIIGTTLFRGEEVDLITRALAQGLRIAYDPRVTVHHRIGSSRMRKAYFRKFMFDNAQFRSLTEAGISGPSFLGAPLWSYLVALYRFVRWARFWVCRRPGAFDQELAWWAIMGELSGHWRAQWIRRLRHPRLAP
jgi:glycosyltransferase involved in cell wall biosynthesis